MPEFEHFKVPPLLMRDLYTDKLIALNETGSAAQERSWESQSEGGNTNGFWLFYRLPGGVLLPQADKQYLATIIQACRRQSADCFFLNLDGLNAKAWQDWAPAPHPSQLWLIGLEPDDIGLPARFPAFQVQTLGNTSYLHTPPLSALQDKASKTRLWQSLQQLFQL